MERRSRVAAGFFRLVAPPSEQSLLGSDNLFDNLFRPATCGAGGQSAVYGPGRIPVGSRQHVAVTLLNQARRPVAEHPRDGNDRHAGREGEGGFRVARAMDRQPLDFRRLRRSGRTRRVREVTARVTSPPPVLRALLVRVLARERRRRATLRDILPNI